MAIKPHLFLLASFLLVATCAAVVAPSPAPVKKAPAPQVKPVASPPPSPPVAPYPPVAKPPTPTPPVAKPPTPTPVAKPKPPTTPPPPLAKPPTPPRNTKECYPLCLVRCKLHSRQNVCLRACVTCCDRCKCVPPGQSGNKEVCGPCYTNMKTHGGRPKCP